jgi:hypothetical protein
VCALWTSSKYASKSDRAYAFYYTGYKNFTRTLTEREKKEIEFEKARHKRELGSLSKIETFEETLQRRGDEERILQVQLQILRNMGDDSLERADNLIKDNKRRRDLWLTTPVEMRCNEERPYKNTIRSSAKETGYAILPVADKKWQGKL